MLTSRFPCKVGLDVAEGKGEQKEAAEKESSTARTEVVPEAEPKAEPKLEYQPELQPEPQPELQATT